MSNYYHLKITVWARVEGPHVFEQALPRLFANSRLASASEGLDGEWVIRVMDFDTTEGSASAVCGMVARSLAEQRILAQINVDLWDAENPSNTHHTRGFYTHHAAMRRAAAIERERVSRQMDETDDVADED